MLQWLTIQTQLGLFARVACNSPNVLMHAWRLECSRGTLPGKLYDISRMGTSQPSPKGVLRQSNCSVATACGRVRQLEAPIGHEIGPIATSDLDIPRGAGFSFPRLFGEWLDNEPLLIGRSLEMVLKHGYIYTCVSAALYSGARCSLQRQLTLFILIIHFDEPH